MCLGGVEEDELHMYSSSTQEGMGGFQRKGVHHAPPRW